MMTVAEAATRKWDVCVIGAGPAGAIAAYECARRNTRVILIEKSAFPRTKVCGCCLNGAAISQLNRSGLYNVLKDCHGVRLHEIRLSDGVTATLQLPNSVALSRSALDAAIVKCAINAGAIFLPQTKALVGAANSCTRIVTLKAAGTAATVHASVVIAADGLAGKSLDAIQNFERHSSPRAHFGAGTLVSNAPNTYESGKLYMACGSGGYVGLVRIQDGRLNVAAALSRRFTQQTNGIANAVSTLLARSGFQMINQLHSQTWRGTSALTQHRQCVSAERLLVIGDAAGYVEPITGEGIAWALASGAAVASFAIAGAASWTSGIANGWAQAHEQLRAPQKTCSVVSTLMRSRVCLRAATKLLSTFPLAAQPLIKRLNAGAA